MPILDFIFPKKCLECGRAGNYICEDCLKKVRSGGLSKDHISIFMYEGVVRKAILALKYKYSTEIAKELAEICIYRLESLELPKDTTLVPVPLHWYRKNFRGFNQSEEIGKIIAKKMNWNFMPDLLIKIKSTKSQVELKGSARKINLKEAFKLNPKYKIPASVIIFDDVYTTGSTLREAMDVLIESGTEKVWGLTIAR